MSQQRLSVREAAEMLGISTDGVRMRVSRGSMESEKDDAGRVWVWLDPAHADTRDRNLGGEQRSEEVESLREQVGYLRSVIEVRDVELRRAHQLLGESLSQLRALSPPADATADPEAETSEPRETSDASPHGAAMPDTEAEPSPGLGERLRRWGRKIFGG